MTKRSPGKELSRQRRATPQARILLSDAERLPLPAAVDMLMLAIASDGRIRPATQRELDRVADRLCSEGDTRLRKQLSTSLLATLAAVGPSGGLGVEAVSAARRITEQLLLLPAPPVREVALEVLNGSDQFASAVAQTFVMLGIGGANLDIAADAVQTWLQPPPGPGRDVSSWKEMAAATGKDVLISAVIVGLAERGDVQQATKMAVAWPPLRTALSAFITHLVRHETGYFAANVAAKFAPGGMLFRTVVETLRDAAQSAPTKTARQTAEDTLRQLEPSADAPSPARAPGAPVEDKLAARADIVTETLSHRDAADLVEVLMTGPDAEERLLAAIERYPGRGRFVKSALRALDKLSLRSGFEARCAWLSRACAGWPSFASSARMRRFIVDFRQSARALGEPALAEQYLTALAENHDEPALLAILTAAS